MAADAQQLYWLQKLVSEHAPSKEDNTPSYMVYLPATSKPYGLHMADMLLPLDAIDSLPDHAAFLLQLRDICIWKCEQLKDPDNAEYQTARKNFATFLLQAISTKIPFETYCKLITKCKYNQELSAASAPMRPTIDKLNEQIARCCSLPACPKRGANKRCQRCKKAYYCNTDCQRADWERHRITCLQG